MVTTFRINTVKLERRFDHFSRNLTKEFRSSFRDVGAEFVRRMRTRQFRGYSQPFVPAGAKTLQKRSGQLARSLGFQTSLRGGNLTMRAFSAGTEHARIRRMLQVFESDNGAAKVVVYSLNGVNLGSLNDVIQPVFAGSTLRSLTIRDNPSAPIGIQVISQHKVSIINDLRRDPNASLRFVVSSAPIGRAMLRGPMDGFDINNTLLSDGVLTPEDIDGDGVIGDDTAVYVIGAGIDSLMLEELNGSAVTDEALVNLFVRGETRNADIVSGSTSNVLRSTYRFGDVAFSSLTTTTPIASPTANEWRVQRPGTDDVTAPSVGALRIIGVDGEFNGDLTLTGAGVSDPMPTLGSVLVRGIVFGTTWTIGGGVTSVSLLGGANNWSIDAAGDGGVVSARASTP